MRSCLIARRLRPATSMRSVATTRIPQVLPRGLAGVFSGALLALALLGNAGAVAAQTPQKTLASTPQKTTQKLTGLEGLNQKEAKANSTWSMRAGLNVAALQCQFSPFLMSVNNYNAFLRQHSDELADSFKTMTGYFVRTRGKAGQRAFDTYATRTNQGYATFDAQYSFCEAAAMLARRALAVPKGSFASFAEAELAQFRTSLLTPVPSQLLAPRLEWAEVPVLKDPCPGKPGCRRR